MNNDNGSLAIRRHAAEQVLEACINSEESVLISSDGNVERVVEIPAFESRTGILLVSNLGRVYRCPEDGGALTELFGSRNTDGYMAIVLRNKETGEKVKILRSNLVYIAFNHTAPGKGYDIDHINADRTDDRLCNLRVISHAENVRRGREKISATMKGNYAAGLNNGYVVVLHTGSHVTGILTGKANELSRQMGVDRRFFSRGRGKLVSNHSKLVQKDHPNDGTKCIIIPVDYVNAMSKKLIDDVVKTGLYGNLEDKERDKEVTFLVLTLQEMVSNN